MRFLLRPAAMSAALGAVLSAAPLAAQTPVSVREALALAARRNPQLRAATAAADRASADRMAARAALRNRFIPTLSASASVNRLLQNQFAAIERRLSRNAPADSAAAPPAADPLLSVFGARLTSTYQLDASITPLDFGRATHAHAAARAAVAVAELGVTSARAQLALDVIAAYGDAQLAHAYLVVADSAVAQASRALTAAQLGFDTGKRAEFDVVRARTAQQSDLVTLAQARTAALVAMQRLRALIGAGAMDSLVLTDTLDTMPTASVAGTDGFGRRIGAQPVGVSQAELGVTAQRAALRAAEAERRPLVSLTLSSQRLSYPAVPQFGWRTTFPNTTAGILVTIPLDLTGRTKAAIRAAQANVALADAQLELSRQQATLDRVAATGDRENAITAYTASRTAADEAERAFRIAEVRYQEGRSSQVELTDARAARARALAARARAARDLHVAEARLALLPALPLQQGSPVTAAITITNTTP